ncbi:MAG: hypothetical protein AAFZ07_18260 [Actinomycetota bacterium]
MSAQAYPDLPGLEEVYLEGAPVDRLVVNDDRVVLVVRAALLGGHPDYAPPPRGETHHREPLLLDWRKTSSIRWDRTDDPDVLGLLDRFEVAGDRMTLVGGFGRLVIQGRPPRVGRPRN